MYTNKISYVTCGFLQHMAWGGFFDDCARAVWLIQVRISHAALKIELRSNFSRVRYCLLENVYATQP